MTNLVRVALEPIALVFLRERRAEGRRKELSSRENLYACAHIFKHFQFKLETLLHFYREQRTKDTTTQKKTKARYLFAHVQLELLHGRVVELQTAHELVRLERHDDA